MWHVQTLVNNKYVSTLYTRLNKTYTLGTLTLLRGNISNNIVAYASNATWCSERNCQNYFFKVHIASNLGSLGLSQERRGWINLAHVLQWISSACRALVLERGIIYWCVTLAVCFLSRYFNGAKRIIVIYITLTIMIQRYKVYTILG